MALFNDAAEKSIEPEYAKATLQPPKVRAADSPRQAGLASPEPSRAYLDPGCKIIGKLSFEGPTRIDGNVDGEISVKDSLMIGETAVVTAQIEAASIIVAGKVSGEIVAHQRVEIRPSGKLSGKLITPLLVVHEGALFDGHCSMQPDGALDRRKSVERPKHGFSEGRQEAGIKSDKQAIDAAASSKSPLDL